MEPPELAAAIALMPGVVHEVSAPYRPQSNSLAESFEICLDASLFGIEAFADACRHGGPSTP